VPLKQTDLYQHQFISSLSSSMSHLRSTTRFILSQIQRQTLRKNNPQTLSRNVTALSLASKKRKGKKITMVTAYDYPSAIHVQRADIDVILVGDSVAMVELGFDNTQPMTLDQMIHHCQAVNRGVSASMNWCSKPKPKKPLLIGDMPFGSYEYNDLDIGLKNAYRIVKEGGMDAIKLEGGSKHRADTIRHIVDGGGEITHNVHRESKL